jgi:hypothetical protein
MPTGCHHIEINDFWLATTHVDMQALISALNVITITMNVTDHKQLWVRPLALGLVGWTGEFIRVS